MHITEEDETGDHRLCQPAEGIALKVPLGELRDGGPLVIDEQADRDGEKLEGKAADPGCSKNHRSKNHPGGDTKFEFGLHQEPTAKVGWVSPPNRRSRQAYCSIAAKNVSRVKSGQRSGMNSNSE